MVGFIRNSIKGLKEFYEKSLYVWRLSKKPGRQELKEKIRIVFIGILILGFLGFLITVLFNILP